MVCGGVSTLKKEKSLCRRVVKDKEAVGEEPVKEEEGVAAADLRIVSAPTAESERRINQANRAMSRNAQNAGELCEESKLTSAPRAPLTISAVRAVARSL
jgi:hypothetical protein